jgi:hypothetical protein
MEPSTHYRLSLRRYSRTSTICSLGQGYHNATVVIGTIIASTHPASEAVFEAESEFTGPIKRADSRWPLHCACGQAFTDADPMQVNYDTLYTVTTGERAGELYTLRDAPVGAMWDADWMPGDHWRGPDGIVLVVRTPGGDWHIDGECSNCTRTQYGPQEIDGQWHERVWLGKTHQCWPRKGDPRTGTVDVRKEHGDTCSAGAGSIIIGGYHGFLHDGFLTAC